MRLSLAIVVFACSLAHCSLGKQLKPVVRPEVNYARQHERRQNAPLASTSPTLQVNTASRLPVTHIGGVAINQLVSDSPYSLHTTKLATPSSIGPAANTQGDTAVYRITALPALPSDSQQSSNRSYVHGRQRIGPRLFIPLIVVGGTVAGALMGWWLSGKLLSREIDDDVIAGPKYTLTDDKGDNGEDGWAQAKGPTQDEADEMLLTKSHFVKPQSSTEFRSWMFSPTAPSSHMAVRSKPSIQALPQPRYTRVQLKDEGDAIGQPGSPSKSRRSRRVFSKKPFQQRSGDPNESEHADNKSVDVFGEVKANEFMTLPLRQTFKAPRIIAELTKQFAAKYVQLPSVSPTKAKTPMQGTPEFEAGTLMPERPAKQPAEYDHNVGLRRHRTTADAFAHHTRARSDFILLPNLLKNPPRSYSPTGSRTLNVGLEGTPSKNQRSPLRQMSSLGALAVSISSTLEHAGELISGGIKSSAPSNGIIIQDDKFTPLPTRKPRAAAMSHSSSPRKTIRPVGSTLACSVTVKSVDAGILPHTPPLLTSPQLESSLFFGSASSVPSATAASESFTRNTPPRNRATVVGNRNHSPKKQSQGRSTSPKERYEARRMAMTNVDNILSRSWSTRHENGGNPASETMFGGRIPDSSQPRRERGRHRQELSLVEEVELGIDYMLADLRSS